MKVSIAQGIAAIHKTPPAPKKVKRSKRARRTNFNQGTPAEQRAELERDIIRTIKKYGPVSAGDVAEISNHSRTGVFNSISRLNENLIFNVELYKPEKGKMVTLYTWAGE
ncbi:MAG: hypothetical protein GY905_11595 [Gammaproteobacteria bacterium]|nr:hypothetical protein [Gammaproteobacteria bacterium]